MRAKELNIPPRARSTACISDDPVYMKDIIGRNRQNMRIILVISPCICLRPSLWVKTAEIGSANRAVTAENTTRRANALVAVKRKPSRIMSNLPMPYSAEHTLTSAPPIAWAGTKRM